jgi:hypothetical protein
MIGTKGYAASATSYRRATRTPSETGGKNAFVSRAAVIAFAHLFGTTVPAFSAENAPAQGSAQNDVIDSANVKGHDPSLSFFINGFKDWAICPGLKQAQREG